MMDTREAVARAIEIAIVERTMHHPVAQYLPRLFEWLLPKVADAAIAAHLKALADAGMVVVPREPTEAMVGAAYSYDSTDKTYDSRDGSDFGAIYRAMIQAVDND